MKKTLSLLLAVIMVLSLAVPAFATANTATVTDLTEGVECELTSTVSGATISIVAPTSASIVLNPYKLEIKENESDTKGVKDQVISPAYFIENKSSLDIEVGISMTASADGVTFVDTPTKATTGHEKNLCAFMELKAAKDKTVSSTGWTKGESFTAASDTLIPLATTAKTGKIVLKATDDTAASPKNNDTLQFKFAGVANDSTSSPWNQDNAVTATIAFTFKVDGTTTTTP